MGAVDKKTLALSKKYTDDSIGGAGAIKGAPCQIQSITEITGGHRVTFSWQTASGTKQTQTLDVMDGEQGVQGIKGDTGNTGATGAVGATPNIQIGNVQSADVAQATITGTAENPVLNLTLPKGDKGERGEKGEDGQNGSSFSIRSRFATEDELRATYPDGPENEGDAYFVGTGASPDLYIWLSDESDWHNNGPIAGVKGDKGDVGEDGFSPVASVSKENGTATIVIRDKTGQTTASVSDGANGSDGKSAYEVAVDAGFVGTEEEWLASLVGAKGDDGSNGANGTDGVSPVANVTKTGDVYKIHIEDASGVTEQSVDMSSYAKQTDMTSVTNRLSTAESDIDGIEAVIPSGASESNKLVTNSDTEMAVVQTNSATWIKITFDEAWKYPLLLGVYSSHWGAGVVVSIEQRNVVELSSGSGTHITSPAYYHGSTAPYYYYIQVRSHGTIPLFVTNVSRTPGITIEALSETPDVSDLVSVPVKQLVTALTTSDLTSTVTSGSNAPITSGGVYSALNTVSTTNVTLSPTNNTADNVTLNLQKVGKVVTASFFASRTDSGTLKSNWTSIGTIPTGYRPKSTVYITINHANSHDVTVGLQFSSNGAIAQYNYTDGNLGYERSVNVSWIVA